MTRVLGVDLGTVRIGVAVSDPTGVLATPVTVIRRTGDRARDHELLADLARTLDATRLVIGVPYQLDGRVGTAARAALDESEQIAAATGLPVETADERFTTTSAHLALRDAGLDSRKRRDAVDAAAATILLQAWLDGRRADTAYSQNEDSERE